MASFLWIPILFSVSLFWLYIAASSLVARYTAQYDKSSSFGGQLEKIKDDGVKLHFPTSLEDTKKQLVILRKINSEFYGHTFVLFTSAYLFKQTFAIPGSVAMNILAGALYGPIYGLAIVCILTAVGASLCFCLSHFFARRYVVSCFGSRMHGLREQVGQSTDAVSLFSVLISLRLFPASPNWLINMSSPLLDVPLYLFFPSVFLGLIPYNLLCCSAGAVLNQLSTSRDIFTWSSILYMASLSAVSLLPFIIIRCWRKNNNFEIQSAIEKTRYHEL